MEILLAFLVIVNLVFTIAVFYVIGKQGFQKQKKEIGKRQKPVAVDDSTLVIGRKRRPKYHDEGWELTQETKRE
jgi:hypothetical protein